MMRLTFLIWAALGICLSAYAGNAPYAVSNIPAALLKNANVVKRMEDVRFEINSLTETVLHRKYAITILNESGDDEAALAEPYDQLRQVRSIEGTLYDAAGAVLKRTKSKDIQDLSGVEGSNLMDDNRVKTHHFYCKAYPYTVEYEVEIRFNNTLFFPRWVPQEGEKYAVEKSKYTLVAPAGYKVRYKAFQYAGEPLVTTEKNKQVMTWEVANLPAIRIEYASPDWYDLTTMLFTGPTDFEIEGYKGNMSSWQEFGKFVYSLKKDRDELPEDIKQQVHELIAGAAGDKEKISRLYQFMQQHTRYVGIQLGIGGWQPFNASYVAKKGYGDCKALTNYMYSLLKEAGIRSNYTLVIGGPGRKVIDDFPSQQFNHVILSVPLAKDTVWLECTSQSLPAGYVSSFTANRKALVVDETGGTLVHTPVYDRKENLQLRTIKGTLDENGTLMSAVHTRYTDMQQDELHNALHQLSKDKVKEMLRQDLELATYDIDDFKYEQMNGQNPEIREELQIAVANYATITGKRLFIAPNVLNRSSKKLTADDERMADIVFGFGFTDVDSIALQIPAGYEVEAVPKEVAINTDFGTYTSRVQVAGNQLYYYRKREQYTGRFPAKVYAQLAAFYTAIYNADRSRVVLVKKE